MFTRDNLKLAGVAAFCLAVGLAGPSVAGAVQQGLNADQVDGKHAVDAKAKIVQRRNKLVATNKHGYLPNNIIRSANKVGGKSLEQLRSFSVPYTGMSGEISAGFGVALADNTTATATFSLTLPLDRDASTPLHVDLSYTRLSANPCTASIGFAGTHLDPVAGTRDSFLWRLPGGAASAAVPLLQNGRIILRADTEDIKPGDTLTLHFSRLGSDPSDACSFDVYVAGALVRY